MIYGYIKNLYLTIMGCLMGGRVKNITKCINAMLRYKNYDLQFTMSYNLQKEALKKGCSRVDTRCKCKGPISNCAKCLLLLVIIISSCPKRALVWGNCREKLRVEIFVRVLRSSEVISLILCK